MIQTLRYDAWEPSAFLGDTHFGVRGDSLSHAAHQRRFFEEVFFPELRRRGIRRIFQLGDLFDRRKFVNFNTLRQFHEMFLDVILEEGMELHVLIGNHDIYWRDTLELNSPQLLVKEHPNIHLHTEPSLLEFGGFRMLVVPWICNDNEENVLNAMSQNPSDLLLGHFEIQGFEMLRGVASEKGLEEGIFSDHKQVLSGHYHTFSRGNNICYLGTPYQLTWGDAGDTKRFAVLEEPDVRCLKYIENPITLYDSIEYDDTCINYDEFLLTGLEKSYVRVVVKKRVDETMFDRFVDRIERDTEPYDIKIIDETLSVVDEGRLTVQEAMDPLTVLIGSVSEEVEDASEVRRVIQELYTEALSMGNMHD